MTEPDNTNLKKNCRSAIIEATINVIARLIAYTGKSEILSSFGWLLAEKTVQIAAGIVIATWVARYLGPIKFGELTYALTVVGIFQIISQFGINNILIRDFANQKESQAEIIQTAFYLKALGGLFCFIAAGLVINALSINQDETKIITMIIAGTLFFQPSEILYFWLQSQYKSNHAAFAKIIATITSCAIRIALITIKAPLIAFAFAFLFESVFFALALIIFYYQHPATGTRRWSSKRALQLLKEGSPFMISGVLLTAYSQLDKIFLARISSIEEVGHYAAAANLALALNFLPVIICTSMTPRLALLRSSYAQNTAFTKLYGIFFWLSVLCSLPIFIFANDIIFLLYGEKFQSSVFPMRILALSITPIFLSVANDYLALISGKSRATLTRTLIGLLINGALNILLIPSYGAEGAAFSALIAHWVTNTVIYWLIMNGSFQLQLSGIKDPWIFRS